MTWLGRLWWLPFAALIFLVFRALEASIPGTVLRALAAAAIVTGGGVLLVAALAALRGLLDRAG